VAAAAEAPRWVAEVDTTLPPPVAITDTSDVAVLRADLEALTDRVDAIVTVQAADHDTILSIQGQDLRVQEQIERLKDRMSAFTVIYSGIGSLLGAVAVWLGASGKRRE
jgi:hypothetical protein